MKNRIKLFGIVAIVAIIGFSFVSCDIIFGDESGDNKPPEIPGGFKIGDTGPGGGKIFYVSVAGFVVSAGPEWPQYTAHYLEVATDPFPQEKWTTKTSGPWPKDAYDSRTSEEGIGKGRRNTAFILEVDENAPAALACVTYSKNGKDDWFLPSADELIELSRQKSLIGETGNPYVDYWSSSKSDLSTGTNTSFPYARAVQFNKNSVGTIGTKEMKDDLRLRAIRAF